MFLHPVLFTATLTATPRPPRRLGIEKWWRESASIARQADRTPVRWC